MKKKLQNIQSLNDELLSIALSLTSEHNFDVLMEKIMLSAKKFTQADAGTVYVVSDDQKHLDFKVVHTDKLKIKMGGTGEPLEWPPLPMYDNDGKPNLNMVAVTCALKSKLLNFPDVYEVEGFNFEGTKAFDQSTGYRSTSMLVVPMLDRDEKVIGVLQLLNKTIDGEIIAYDKKDESLISSMASLAAVAIQNNKLIKNLEDLLDAFIETIVNTLEKKSQYTEHHIVRVSTIMMMIVDAVNKDSNIYKDKHYSKEELKELQMSGMLHDIGKIIQPEHVVDKATRLETIVDRIEMIDNRFEILKRDNYIKFLEDKENLTNQDDIEKIKKEYEAKIESLNDDQEFIRQCNTKGFLPDSDLERIKLIGSYKVVLGGKEVDFFSEDELYNLSIRKGTLTDDEREIINNHVKVSYSMLKDLPFPDKYKRVPKIAGSHHKAVDGKGGYGHEDLMGIPLEFEEKILAISDVFEALTSPERPYKKPFTLNESFRIMFNMVEEGHLDGEIIKFVLDNDLHTKYAKENLTPEQLDVVERKL